MELVIPLQSVSAIVKGDFDVRGLSGAAEVDPRVQQFHVNMTLAGPDDAQAAQLVEQFSIRCPLYTTLNRVGAVSIKRPTTSQTPPRSKGWRPE